MKIFLRIIALIVITCIVGFILFYLFRPVDQVDLGDTASSTPTTRLITNDSKDLPVSIKTISENSSTEASVALEYPQFPTLPADFNIRVKASVMDRLTEFREYADKNNDYSFLSKWQSAQINARYVSFIIRFDSYTGGINEEQELETFNYDVENEKLMSLSDLFPKVPDYLKQISTESRRQLIANLNTTTDGNAPVDTINTGTEPLPENFQNFTFTDTVLQIYFPEYSVAAGTFGEQHVTIPLSSIK